MFIYYVTYIIYHYYYLLSYARSCDKHLQRLPLPILTEAL